MESWTGFLNFKKIAYLVQLILIFHKPRFVYFQVYCLVSTGYASVMQNIGKTENKGIEVTLNTIWFQNKI